jgi:amino acid transporter
MVNYSLLDVGDPLAFVFAKLKWMSGIIAVSAVIAMASRIIQNDTRIWMSMSRDGLPKRFSKIHPTLNTILCYNRNRICGCYSCFILL